MSELKGMSGFTDALVVSPLADGKTGVLVRSFGYEVGALGSGDVIDCQIGLPGRPGVFKRILKHYARKK